MATAQQPQQQQSKGLALKKDPRQMQFKALLDSEGFQDSLKKALPRQIRPAHMVRVVLGALQTTPKLLDCTPESVLLSIMRAASLGLEPDGGVLGHGYLVPYWNGRERRLDCQFIPGYRGLCKMARNSGEIADIWAEVVYEADAFDYSLGLEQGLKHRRNDDAPDPGALKYAYAVARFRDGEKKFVVMNRREVEAIKNRSSSKNRDGKIVGPWVDHEAEMWKKTAIRRLCKQLPLSAEVVSAIEVDDEAERSFVMDAIDVQRPKEDLPSSETPAIEQSTPEDPAAAEDPDPFGGPDDSDAPAGEAMSIRDTIQAELDKTSNQEEINEAFNRWTERLTAADKDWLFEAVEARAMELKKANGSGKGKQGELLDKGSPSHA